MFWGACWQLGFLDELRLDCGVRRGAGTAALAALFRAPASRWLRELQIGMPARAFEADAAPILELANLRGLRIVDGGGLGDRDLHAFTSYPPRRSGPVPARLAALKDSSRSRVSATTTSRRPRRCRGCGLISGSAVTDQGVGRIGDAVQELTLSYCPHVGGDALRRIADRPLESFGMTSHEPGDGLVAPRAAGARQLHVDHVTDMTAALAAVAELEGLRDVEPATSGSGPASPPSSSPR